MRERTIGGRAVSAVGLGGMPMSIEGRPDEERSIATVHAALEAGVTLIDTADAYHLDAGEVGHNESLIAKALCVVGRAARGRPRRDQGRAPAPRRRVVDPRRRPAAPQARPRRRRSGGSASTRSASTSSTVPTPPCPTPSPSVRSATCSTRASSRWPASRTRTRRRSDEAQEVLGGRLVSVQNQFSPAFRSSRPELDLAPSSASLSCRGARSAASARPGTSAAGTTPSQRSRRVAGVSPQRVALAWELALAPVVVPIPGASRPESIQDSAPRPTSS